MLDIDRVAINPLQFVATPDGWIDPGLAPPLDHQLDVVAGAGFRHVHCAVPSDMTPETYRQRLREHGLAAGPGYLSLKWSEEPARRVQALEDVRRTAAANAAAGSQVSFLAVNMAPGAARVQHAATGHAFDEGRFAGVVAHLAAAAALAVDEGVVPALHPHVGTWVETEEETRRVLAEVSPDVLKFGPDTGHLTWAGADTVGLLADHVDRIVGIHLKDVSSDVAQWGRSTAADYRSTVVKGLWREPGGGDTDFDAVFSALGADWRGWTVVEVDKGFLEPAGASIAACGDWVRAHRR